MCIACHESICHTFGLTCQAPRNAYAQQSSRATNRVSLGEVSARLVSSNDCWRNPASKGGARSAHVPQMVFAERCSAINPLILLERAKGIEPSTLSLGS